ncbi:GntR family transcriptional regulator [Kitasatospora sp. MAP5-34]|uniref:GntR family transcriptional regulator n=1 Tax=Kitasatospora sp. MAP5-34 TaxID=3035102 RepID=UPI00247D1831|nr:DNA-binding GntR family transcriptional regulator [Kitasatospora sp. MAP5-34]
MFGRVDSSSVDSGGVGASTPIQRNSLREQIAGALRDEMMAGRLAAGRNFTVKEIAELYGVSATPAREALVDLAAQGLLRAEHHRGFTVPEFTWADYLEIFESRALLTDSAFSLLGTRGSGYDWTRLSSLRRRAEAADRAARSGQLDVLVGCDRRFWQEAGALLGNRRMAGYLDWLRVQSWMFAAPYLRSAQRLDGVCWDRNTELVDRIEARDVSGAHRTISEYNLFTIELLARLTGNSLDSVSVLPLLTSRITAGLAAETATVPAEKPEKPEKPGKPECAERAERFEAAEAAEVSQLGLGAVPLPRFVPPGRLGRPLLPGGGGTLGR